jgi:diguanylate cyclase (GGDEF)-like protein
MARKYRVKGSSGYTIVLADDDPDYLEATRLLLESEGHEVYCARNGEEALALLRANRAHLLLLDYFMPGMTGEDVVVALRAFDPHIQVILQTGYASEHPPREMLRRLDIQGYYDKSEGPDRLLLWTDAGLKAAAAVLRLYQSRQSLRFILDVTPSMHKIQPIADLAGALLAQLGSLLRAGDAFLAARPPGEAVRLPPAEAEGCVAILQDDSDLVLCAASGSFTPGRTLVESLAPEELEALTAALERGEPAFGPASTILPLRVGELTVGVIFARAGAASPPDVELLKIFGNQATVAMQNTQLYEMAALDPLTGVYARRFLERWILREIRAAFRSRQPLSMLLLDLDDLKGINDSAGHLAGDQALAAMGKALRQATRDTDVVARYGGDEFVVLLPQTAADDAEMVGQRILQVLVDRPVASPQGGLSLRSSAGVSVLPAHTFSPDDLRHPFPQGYFQAVAQNLIREADAALYHAKRQGRGRLCRGDAIRWDPIAQ